MNEKHDGEKVFIKLTNKDMSQLLNGKILEGYKVSIVLEVSE